MKRIKNILSSYKITAVCLIVLMMVSSNFASISTLKFNPKEAMSIQEIFNDAISINEKKGDTCIWYKSRAYFSDASHTTYVGTKIWYCDGYIGVAGAQTLYYIEEFCECDPQS